MAKRKMTPEQKAAAVERLAKAREKRLRENPPKYKNIDPSVLARGEDDPFYFRKVQGWIKTQKELLSTARQGLRRKEKGAEARVANHQAYIRNLDTYLRSGLYVDDFYGEMGEHKIKWRCVAPAYDSEGMVKRTHGVFYNDIGTVYTGQEEFA
jgi:hypothetical protein